MLSALISAMAFVGLGCTHSHEVNLSDMQLEGNDTIVTIGKYHILIPLSTACDWTVFSKDDTTGISFAGSCPDVSNHIILNVILIAELDTFSIRMKDEINNIFNTIDHYLDMTCEFKQIKSEKKGNKKWKLCSGRTSLGGNIHSLIVDMNTKKYRLCVVYEMGEDRFTEFINSNEVERVVDGIQIWRSDG